MSHRIKNKNNENVGWKQPDIIFDLKLVKNPVGSYWIARSWTIDRGN
jgi:hypothetical protein